MAETGPPARRPGPGRRIVIGGILLGAGLILLAATRTWASVHVGQIPGVSHLSVSGRRAAPAAIPVALAAAAGAVVLATSGRVVRMVVGAGLILGGVILAVVSVRLGRNATGALSSALRDSLGLISRRSDPGAFGASFAAASVRISPWPWTAAAGAGLIAAAGFVTILRGWSWPGPARRFERSTGPGSGPVRSGSPGRVKTGGPPTRDHGGSAGTWDALSRGEDPTAAIDDPT